VEFDVLEDAVKALEGLGGSKEPDGRILKIQYVVVVVVVLAKFETLILFFANQI
jgi:hypothetical protein